MVISVILHYDHRTDYETLEEIFLVEVRELQTMDMDNNLERFSKLEPVLKYFGPAEWCDV